MQPLQICIGPIIRIGRESWCLPYAGFFITDFVYQGCYFFVPKLSTLDNKMLFSGAHFLLFFLHFIPLNEVSRGVKVT